MGKQVLVVHEPSSTTPPREYIALSSKAADTYVVFGSLFYLVRPKLLVFACGSTCRGSVLKHGHGHLWMLGREKCEAE